MYQYQKKGRPLKREKTSASLTKKKYKKTTMNTTNEVVDLGGDSSLEEERFA